MSATRSNAPRAPATEHVWKDAALVLCAHGIRGGPGVAVEHARAIERRGLFAEVAAACHKGRPGALETLAEIRSPRVFVVPLLMAEGFTLRTMLRKLEPALRSKAGLMLCRPVGVHPHFSLMMARRALAVCARRRWRPSRTSLVIAGHGTRRDANSGATARDHAKQIEDMELFGEVVVAFLDEPPAVPEVLSELRMPQCVAVGLFLDRGEHGEEDVPKLLAPAGERAAYAGPVGTDPRVVELVLDQVRVAAVAGGVEADSVAKATQSA